MSLIIIVLDESRPDRKDVIKDSLKTSNDTYIYDCATLAEADKATRLLSASLYIAHNNDLIKPEFNNTIDQIFSREHQ